LPSAPAHLSDASKSLWKATVSGWDLDLHHHRLLALACDALDLAEQARVELVAHGSTTITDGGAHRAHPATAIARDNRTLAARLIRDLNLDQEAGNAR